MKAKGYWVDAGYVGFVCGIKFLFPSESEYLEFIRESEESGSE